MTDVVGTPLDEKALTKEQIQEIEKKAEEWMPPFDDNDQALLDELEVEGEPEPTEEEMK